MVFSYYYHRKSSLTIKKYKQLVYPSMETIHSAMQALELKQLRILNSECKKKKNYASNMRKISLRKKQPYRERLSKRYRVCNPIFEKRIHSITFRTH